MQIEKRVLTYISQEGVRSREESVRSGAKWYRSSRSRREEGAGAVAYGDDGGRVRVEDAADVGARRVYARVEAEAGLVDAEDRAAAVDEAAVERHLDQAAGGHLVVEQSERVDQEVLVLAGHARLHEQCTSTRQHLLVHRLASTATATSRLLRLRNQHRTT